NGDPNKVPVGLTPRDCGARRRHRRKIALPCPALRSSVARTTISRTRCRHAQNAALSPLGYRSTDPRRSAHQIAKSKHVRRSFCSGTVTYFKLLPFAVLSLNKAGDRYRAIQREVPSDTGPPPERAQGQPYRRTHRELGHELCSSHSSICRARRQGGRRVPAIRTRDETAGARSDAGPTGSTRDHT